VLSAWCGLAAGWLEVGTRILCRHIDATNRLSMMSRHFVWLVPLTDLMLFLAMGMVLAAAVKLRPGVGGWLGPRLICAGAVWPALLVAGPRIYTAAWLTLALGIGSCMARWLERDPAGWRRWLLVSFPALLGAVLVPAGLLVGGDRLKQWREASRPLPPAGSPNVLLIVLDTVRADRLSLYGYPRATSPTLEHLAHQGIRFDEARATAPWTLPSHASMFTGRWPWEISARWMTPLTAGFPTLAEYLGSRGYATAGFVANTVYCSYDTGLSRGFTHYEDYVLDLARLAPFRTAVLVDRGVDLAGRLGVAASRTVGVGPFRQGLEALLRPLLATGRKNAALVNREFLDWLSHRAEPGRPFFAFLNFLDAHAPYLPPEGTTAHFGIRPQADLDFVVLVEEWASVDKLKLPRRYQMLARDSYDNCLAYLDERLGELCGQLRRLGVLDQTLVIITSDHGEELGEHDLFDHGESLYRPEVRVPLLLVLPAGRQQRATVSEPVSLRDLPATVVDLVGLEAGSPFPGRSLARLGRDPSPAAARGLDERSAALSELETPNPANPSQGRSPAARGSLIAMAEGEFVYIRNQRDGTEELFNEREDPRELLNRAGVEALLPVLQRFRARLDRLKPNRPAR
jgi:arylsulfatase A-like enzyme